MINEKILSEKLTVTEDILTRFNEIRDGFGLSRNDIGNIMGLGMEQVRNLECGRTKTIVPLALSNLACANLLELKKTKNKSGIQLPNVDDSVLAVKINLDWLISGEGDMLIYVRKEKENDFLAPPQNDNAESYNLVKEQLIKEFNTHIDLITEKYIAAIKDLTEEYKKAISNL